MATLVTGHQSSTWLPSANLPPPPPLSRNILPRINLFPRASYIQFIRELGRQDIDMDLVEGVGIDLESSFTIFVSRSISKYRD